MAALVNHPELIVEYAEPLADLSFTGDRMGALIRHALDLAAREPHLDRAGLRCHLSEQGDSGVLGKILSPEVYGLCRFARPDATPEEARLGVQHILEGYRRRRAASETDAAGRDLAETMTEEALARLEAKQRQLDAGLETWAADDPVDEAGN